MLENLTNFFNLNERDGLNMFRERSKYGIDENIQISTWKLPQVKENWNKSVLQKSEFIFQCL